MTALADAGVALPTGWLWEDGGTYSRTTYANLFAAVTATLTGHIFIGSSSISGSFRQLPTSTTVMSITSTTIVISQNANANNSSARHRASVHGEQRRLDHLQRA